MDSWRYGDEVEAREADLTGRHVKGVIIGLDWDANDRVCAAAVRLADGTVVSVHPWSLRYQVDRNGFAFRFDKKHFELTVLRNDDKLLDPRWVARRGVYLLADSLAPGRRRKRP